jgi:hypothetical protein|tara:strand:- start:6273 stop:6473 length:201 start_codon:yes stop_codon:yes gene_type:complete
MRRIELFYKIKYNVLGETKEIIIKAISYSKERMAEIYSDVYPNRSIVTIDKCEYEESFLEEEDLYE